VLTYGTFDLFHIGHVNILKKASSLGNLYVGVSSDEFSALKGKETVFCYYERFQIILSIKYVYHAFPEVYWQQKENDIERFNIDCFVMGSDWEGAFDYLPCKVIYMPRTLGISTSNIKEKLK
jgi:glycerol-3-phosphate cytidylyltransferase